MNDDFDPIAMIISVVTSAIVTLLWIKFMR